MPGRRSFTYSTYTVNNSGLKLCIILCYFNNGGAPTFDYEDRNIPIKERKNNEFYLKLKIPEITETYEIDSSDFDAMIRFIENKLEEINTN